MSSLLRDSSSRASDRDVTVRVVADGGRRGRLGGVVSTVAVGLIAGAVLVVAGVVTGLISISNPFSTSSVDRSGPALFREINDLSTYSAAEGRYQQMVDVEDDVDILPAFIAGQRTTFLANGTVDATVDFSSLSKTAVQTAEDGSVVITLPKPKLAEAHIDPKTSRVVGRERGVVDRVAGVFNDTPTGEQRFYVMAQEKLAKAAKHSNLVQRAERNTSEMLRGFLGELGYENVTITFTSPKVGTAGR